MIYVCQQVRFSLLTKQTAAPRWRSSTPCTRSTRTGLYCRIQPWYTTSNTCLRMTRFTLPKKVTKTNLMAIHFFFLSLYQPTDLLYLKVSIKHVGSMALGHFSATSFFHLRSFDRSFFFYFLTF